MDCLLEKQTQWGLYVGAIVVALGRRFSRFLFLFFFFFKKNSKKPGSLALYGENAYLQGQQAEGSQLSILTVFQIVSFK